MATGKQVYPYHLRIHISQIQERTYTMKKQITELKEAMQAYISASRACDRAEEEMVRTETEESEKAFDLSYKEMFTAYMDVSKKLFDLIGIGEMETRKMVNTKETEVLALIEKLGA